MKRVIRRQRNCDVFSNGHLFEQGKMLEDHTDPERRRSNRAFQRHLITLPKDLSIRWLKKSVQDFDKRGFSGAILAQKRVNFAFPDFKINTVIGQYRTKALHNLVKANQRFPDQTFYHDMPPKS